MKSITLLKSTFSIFDISEYIKLSKSEYKTPETTNIKHIEWKHCQSPHGGSIYCRLKKSKKVIGRSMIQPRNIIIDNVIIKSGCVSDLLIHVSHRSPPSNFIKLTNACNPNDNFDIIYHTSNKKSEGFYKNLFKYDQPFQLSSYMFPTKISGLILKLIKIRLEMLDLLLIPFYILLNLSKNLLKFYVKIDILERIPDNNELNELLYKIDTPILDRSYEFLKWRFIDCPLWKAKIYCINRNGKFLGYFSIRTISISGLRHLVVVDYLIDRDTSFLDCLFIRLWLIKHSIKLNTDFIFIMINKKSPIAKMANKFPMIPVPDRFLPHSTPIFFRFNIAKRNLRGILITTHLTLADIDYF